MQVMVNFRGVALASVVGANRCGRKHQETRQCRRRYRYRCSAAKLYTILHGCYFLLSNLIIRFGLRFHPRTSNALLDANADGRGKHYIAVRNAQIGYSQ
jgi:hypothetical protein